MLSYRYGVTDGLLETTTTLTIWVGMKDRGCRPAVDPPPLSRRRETSTLLRTEGAVRIRAAGGWRSLSSSHRLTRATMVDARRGSVRVRVVFEDNDNRRVQSGRLGGGVFKLGRNTKLPNGKVVGGLFSLAELAGDLGCRRGVGSGRRLEVAAPSGLIVETTRLRTFPLATRTRPTVARYTITDRCNKTTVVRSGRDGSTSGTTTSARPRSSPDDRFTSRAASQVGGSDRFPVPSGHKSGPPPSLQAGGPPASARRAEPSAARPAPR